MASESALAKCAGATDGACDCCADPSNPVPAHNASRAGAGNGGVAAFVRISALVCAIVASVGAGSADKTLEVEGSAATTPAMQECTCSCTRCSAAHAAANKPQRAANAVQAVLRDTVGLRAKHMLQASCNGAHNMQQRFGAGSIFKASTDAAQALAVAPASDHSLLSQALPLTTAPLPLATAPLPLAISLRLTRNCRRAAHQDSPRHCRVRLAVQRC
jgi:hypothetical protein